VVPSTKWVQTATAPPSGLKATREIVWGWGIESNGLVGSSQVGAAFDQGTRSVVASRMPPRAAAVRGRDLTLTGSQVEGARALARSD
jgi:hypothetical protein